MTGTLKLRFKLSTSSQARRYDILICRPASEIEPCLSIISSSLTLPGPMARSASKSIRSVSFGIALRLSFVGVGFP
jgi:hypothetical protein